MKKLNRKILVITPALPYNQDDALYKLVAELKKKSIEVDLFSGVLPEHEKIIRYYPKSSLFSNIQKNLKKSLLNTSYEAVVFYTGDTVPVFFEKVKSFTPVKTILFNSKENVEEINDVKFDFKAGSIEDVLNFLSRDYNPPEKLTSIIMLTFNQLSLTGQCVRSLEKYTHAPYELIVIDNGSTDGTAEYLRRHENSKDNVRCVFNEENRAFSKANNQGIKIAKGDFILLLNNDVILTDKWLQRLCR